MDIKGIAMTFLYWSWLPLIILFFIFFVYLSIKYENNYFNWIKKYWFFEIRKINFIRRWFYFFGLFLLLLSLLDLRGREEKIEINIFDQKTIIIIDASESMLVEDIKPNRFQKSLLMARHFVKNSIGHKIALVLFSDTQKQLVPFTDDIDLLESRISAFGKH